MEINYSHIWMGTACGTFLSSLSIIHIEDILITAILASIGAVISFLMSCFLNLFLKPKLGRFKRNKKSK